MIEKILNLFFRKEGVQNMCFDKEESDVQDTLLYKEPKICLVDIDTDIYESLRNKGFNCSSGSLGYIIKVPNVKRGDQTLCLLNKELPQNLHEYQILIIDLSFNEIIEYEPIDLNKKLGTKKKALISLYPETLFNPRGLVSYLISNIISGQVGKDFILIVFSAEFESYEYNFVEIGPRGTDITDTSQYNNYSFKENIPIKENKGGKIIKVENTSMGEILNRFKDSFTYEITFNHPAYDRKEKFIPLMRNGDGDIISYLEIEDDKTATFVFPQTKNKNKFIEELLSNVLPEYFPVIFPHNAKFAWTKDYPIPNNKDLLDEKQKITKAYEIKIKDIDEKIKSNYQEYSFLHGLITETDAKLVKAVEVFLNWLGFTGIVNVDETEPELKEEDLKVMIAEGLLVIEVKGIGGTSTDNECSQISKIRYRRAEERGKFDVFGLYIVNHQRYIPPEDRKNPPFNDTQIRDAINDKRGLLSTYDLYKLFFLIEDGIISKEEARKHFIDYGIINFKPQNIISLGVPSEIIKGGKVVIINLNNIELKKGDQLLIYKNNCYTKTNIETIKVNDKEVENVNNGEVGLLLNEIVPKKSELFLKQV